MLIYRDKKSKKYKGAIDDKWGKQQFDNLREAKMAILNVIEILKERGEW